MTAMEPGLTETTQAAGELSGARTGLCLWAAAGARLPALTICQPLLSVLYAAATHLGLLPSALLPQTPGASMTISPATA